MRSASGKVEVTTKPSTNTAKMMFIFDLLLLTFTLAALAVISAARIRGKLPHRGLRHLAQSKSSRAARSAASSANAAAKADNFKGILAHYDGPVNFLEPKYIA